MEFSLIIDALIVVLLVATIIYAAVLNRKLGALRDAKGEMEALLASFSESTERASHGVELLKRESGRSGEALQNKVATARGLVDDLGFLIEKGTSLAERLDGGVGAARAKSAAAKAQGAAPRSNGAPDDTAGGAPDDTAGDTAGDTASGSDPGRDPVPDAGAADLSAAESELLKALQGMR